jgi:hypothetical protein
MPRFSFILSKIRETICRRTKPLLIIIIIKKEIEKYVKNNSHYLYLKGLYRKNNKI